MAVLTKSLHTVTAVAQVARHLIKKHSGRLTPTQAVDRALEVLGYDPDTFSSLDPTVLGAITALRKLLA